VPESGQIDPSHPSRRSLASHTAQFAALKVPVPVSALPRSRRAEAIEGQKKKILARDTHHVERVEIARRIAIQSAVKRAADGLRPKRKRGRACEIRDVAE